ncbi:MAG: hypothetical protein WA740_12970, partial [Candidatus Binataceae bacterium]
TRILARAEWRREALALEGAVSAFVPLSRPGPDHSRIFTTLGFAKFRAGGREGAGMFEHSRVVTDAPTLDEDDEDSPSD